MAEIGVASRVTFMDLSGGGSAQTVESGEPIIVNGVVFTAGPATTTITVTTADSDQTTFMIVRLAASTTVTMDIPFIADKGLRVVPTTGDCDVSIFHLAPGR